MSRMLSYGLTMVVATVMAVSATPDNNNRCSAFSSSCQVCLAQPDCGWCSEDVTYPDGSKGTRCAGLSPNGKQQFKCSGLYSTGKCQAGYECNQTNFQCMKAAPGHGNSQDQCEAKCTNHGQVYKCNHTTKTCHQVPAGTPGSSGLSVCEASCIHPSAHPSSAHPHPPAQTYSCNKTSGKCETAQPGHGASKEVCEKSCQNPADMKYFCDVISHQCKPVPAGQPGESKTLCEATCQQHPNPGPPAQFQGLWRGIEIQNGYKVGEWDMQFSQTEAVIVDVISGVTIKGTPYNVINGDSIDMWIKITSGPNAGQTIKAIGKAEQERGPETKYLTAAFSAAGGAAPSSIADAMKGSSGDKVFFLSSCAGTPECLFVMPSTGLLQKRMGDLIELSAGLKVESEKKNKNKNVLRADNTQRDMQINDHCSQYNASCAECLSHNLCGWCSQDVEYTSGVTGTQCAGFNPQANGSQPFVCKGLYSTETCNVGYKCNEANHTCEIDPIPGNGHTKEVCEALCRPTPAPTKVKEYLCNMTTKKCHLCDEEFCPGAMPKDTCAAACIKPHKGPSKDVAGIWRGIQINENYPLAEIELVLNASKVAMYKNGQMEWSGVVESYGGDVFIFNINGQKVPAIYVVDDQGQGFYSIMTIAFGLPAGDVPQSFAPAMQTKGMYEQVLAKCTGSPCSFNFPAQKP